ncbi:MULTISPECIES: hypothetical protein [unclassified Myroides]|uniref:hypothetical protein n=1 Tax=unclassified Myroides TaxID=2642485 RepID=UPI003D2F5AC6
METKFLLPHSFKKIGWTLLAISVLIWIYSIILLQDDIPFLEMKVFTVVGSAFFKGETSYFGFIETNITSTLMSSLFLIGGLLVAFSREKIEDEFISKLRLQSFQWSFLINYVLLLLLFLLVYGMEFYYVMVYNMFTMLILFILRFHYLLKLNKE